jgi:hypothetical protein
MRGTAARCHPTGECRYSARFSTSATIRSIAATSHGLITARGASRTNTARAVPPRTACAPTAAIAASNCAGVITGAAVGPAEGRRPSSSRVRCSS